MKRTLSFEENVSVTLEPATETPSMVVSGGTVSTFHERVAGLVSILPAASVARTVNACCPSARFEWTRGEEQGVRGSPSSAHWKVTPVSFELNPKLAFAEFQTPDGPEVMVVSGAAASTVHVRVAALASAFPAGSTARIVTVCVPLVSPVNGAGEVHRE